MTTTPAAAGPQPRTVDRLDRPSLEILQRDYIDRGRPVILRGVTDGWPAMEKWGPDYFRAVAGDSMVRVPYQDHADFFTWFNQPGRVELRMRFGELVDRLTGGDPDPRYYLTEQPLANVSRELLADVDLSQYVGDVEPAMFMGKHTFMPCHYHGHTEALLCQLRSDKEVTLFSPKDWRRLYAHPWYTERYQFSQVDPRNPDLERFPKFADAQPYTFTLHEGEVLYIPVHWWHTTGCAEFNFNITFFWPSKLKRFHFPTPGIQYHAHTAWFSMAVRPLLTLRRKLAPASR